jgi:hypothetical protein
MAPIDRPTMCARSMLQRVEHARMSSRARACE